MSQYGPTLQPRAGLSLVRVYPVVMVARESPAARQHVSADVAPELYEETDDE
jgi:hypothetical protein